MSTLTALVSAKTTTQLQARSQMQRVSDSVQRFLQPTITRQERATLDNRPSPRPSSFLKGAFVAISAAVLPIALLCLVVFTDGYATDEVEGFGYAGLFIFSVMGAITTPLVAVPLWRRLRKYGHMTLIFTLPTAAIVILVLLRVLLGDCLDATVAC